jgi:hypothetical protein
MPTACIKLMQPELTSPTVISVTAVLLCSSAVTAVPVKRARGREPVNKSRPFFTARIFILSRLRLKTLTPQMRQRLPAMKLKAIIRVRLIFTVS